MKSRYNSKVIKVVAVIMVGLVLVGLTMGLYAWKKKLSSAQRQGTAICVCARVYLLLA